MWRAHVISDYRLTFSCCTSVFNCLFSSFSLPISLLWEFICCIWFSLLTAILPLELLVVCSHPSLYQLQFLRHQLLSSAVHSPPEQWSVNWSPIQYVYIIFFCVYIVCVCVNFMHMYVHMCTSWSLYKLLSYQYYRINSLCTKNISTVRLFAKLLL